MATQYDFSSLNVNTFSVYFYVFTAYIFFILNILVIKEEYWADVTSFSV